MKTKEKLNKLAEAMYHVNRHISWIYIAQKQELKEKFVLDLNRIIAEWIKQLREIGENGK